MTFSIEYIIALIITVILTNSVVFLFARKGLRKACNPLKNTGEQFRQIIETIDEALIITGHEWDTVYYVNPAFERLFEQNNKNHIKSPLSIVNSVHTDDTEKVKNFINESISRHLYAGFPDYRICKSDGSVLWISMKLYPLKIDDDNKEKIIAVFSDITDRKTEENKVIKSEEDYRSIINNIEDVFYRSDSAGKIIMISPSVTRILGYVSAQDCIGMSVAEEMYYNPADRNRLITLLSDNGYVADYETTLRKKDGSPVAVSTSSHYYYDDNGNIAGIEGVVRDITKRKRAEDMFNKAFNENPCPMSISDIITGYYIEVNKAWLDALEFERDEVIGHTAPELNIYRNIEERNGIVESIKTTGHAYNMEIEFISKKRNNRNGIFFGEIIDVAGKKMLLSSVLNITGQREAEKLLRAINEELAAANEELTATNEEFEAANEELIATNEELEAAQNKIKDSEKEYRMLTENLSVGLLVYTPELEVILSNPMASLILKIGNEEMDNKISPAPGWDIFDESGSPMQNEDLPFVKVLNTGTPVRDIVIGLRHGNTGLQWLNCDAYPVTDNSGSLTRIIVSFIDITEKKQIEDEVHRLKNYLTNIIESNPDMLVGLNSEMKITLINRKTEDFSGVTMHDATGLPLETVFADFAPSIKTMKSGITNHHPVALHGFPVEKNGEKKYYNLTLYPLVSSGIEGAVVLITDVTDIMKKEEQLRQAQKMETVGNLAGGLAHDFNNVLSGIVGTTSLIKHIIENDRNINERLKTYVDLIDKSGKRAAEMVQQLLTLSRKSEISLMPLNLNDSLKNVIQICQNTFDKSIEISTEYYPSEALIKGDPSQVEQVLLNIFINASHAMTIMRSGDEKQGGILSLSIKKIKSDKYFCAVHPEAVPGEYWMISQSDTGVGIKSVNLHKIFDPFFTTKESDHGTGLGLAMVYSIVHQHGGFIDVYSEPGVGSTFNVFFPVLSEEDINETVAAESGIEKGNGLVLVIDDEDIVRLMAESILVESGYDVIPVSSGREAIKVYSIRKDEIKCVLLDMAMPVMSGKEVYLELKKINPDVKVLLTSGFRQDGRVQETLTLGINGFIQKPYSILELSKKIKEITSS